MGKTLLVVSVLAGLLVAACADSVVGPAWSRGGDGQPTLTGDWLGEIELEPGRQAVLFLHLETPPVIDGLNLTGEAHYCTAGETGHFEVWGDADRDGQVQDLRFVPQEDSPLWLLHYVSSRWQRDTLTLTGYHSYDPSRQHTARSDQSEAALALVMQRSDPDAFRSLCGGNN